MTDRPLFAAALAAALALTSPVRSEPASADPAPIVLQGATVIPMTGERVLPDTTVVIRDGRIAAVGPTASIEVPAGATRIDARGKYLVPGLFDTHVHANDAERDEHLVMYLAAGVTTVQSMHGSPRHLDLRARLASGELLGPRMLTTGPTTARERVDSPEKAERVVHAQHAASYDAIKMYGDGSDSMTRETYARLVEVAHEAGMRVVGHAPRNLPFSVVLEAGQDSIDHMEEITYTHEPIVEVLAPLIDLQFGRVELEDVREAVEAWSALPPQAPAVAARLAAQVKQAGLAVTPTLVAFETIWKHTTPGYDALLASPLLAYMSPVTRYEWGPRRNRYRTSWEGRYESVEKSLRFGLEMQKLLVKAFHEAGVPILGGTDAPLTFVYPGFALHRELELFVECGLTPYDALYAATAAPADELGLGAVTGRIAPGMSADLVLLDADPLADVRNAARISAVVSRGRWLPRERLDRELAALARSYEPLAASLERLREPLEAGDAGEMLRRYRALDSADAAVADFVESAVNRLGYERLGDGRIPEAVEVLRLNTEAFPGSSNTWDSLGEAQLAAGELEAALAGYRKSLALDPGNANAKRLVEWIEFAVRAAAKPVSPTPEELQALAGDYGPRHVAWRDGGLHYERDEVGTEYRLVPLTRDTFALAGNVQFRLRFVAGEDGRPSKVEGLYSDGRIDESPRSVVP